MTIHQFIGEKVKYDTGYIWGINKKGDYEMLVQRGWGAIQKLFKTQEEAAKFQDDLGQWITDAINEKLKREKDAKINR